MFFFNGTGVEKDETKGIELLEQASAEGSPHAAQVLKNFRE